MFECATVHKFAERDNWELGCVGDCQHHAFAYSIKGNTLEEIKQEIAAFVGCEMEAIEVNPTGEEPWRIDAQTIENAEGYPATRSELEAFKRGEIDLWAVTYSFDFECVERTPAVFH